MSNQNTIIGSISQGTMRKEDLIPVFCDTAEYLGASQEFLSKIESRLEVASFEDNQYDYFNLDVSDYDLEELFDVLQELAPPYFYFGSRPGDGADYGFWLCEDVGQMVKDNGGYIVSDLSEVTKEKIEDDGIPDSGFCEVLHVNDHGNATLYSYDIKKDEFNEIWAVV